jgi:hypothetical protein
MSKKMSLMQTNVNNKSLVKKIVGLLHRETEAGFNQFYWTRNTALIDLMVVTVCQSYEISNVA